jgi:membrane protease YdiL (CAAX protease family)
LYAYNATKHFAETLSLAPASLYMLKKNDNQSSSFWNTRKGILLQITIVLLPSILLLRSGTLLLAGLACSVLLSWLALRLQKLHWSDVGLKKPLNFLNAIFIGVGTTIVLIPLSYALRHAVTSMTHQSPNLEAFKTIKGNPSMLMIGLVVAWIFGAFAEEMFFRGFLMNSFYKLFPEKNFNDPLKWILSLLITSILVAFGHSYQGITGMTITGVLGFCFGLIYLANKRSLWPSLLTHGLYDTVAFIFLFYGFSFDQLIGNM